MKNCNDHWCDYYGKDNKNCNRCEKKESERDKPDLQVILNKRKVEQMELSKDKKNEQLQVR